VSKRFWSAVLLVFSLAAASAAQIPPDSPRVTVIGCIQRSEPPTASSDATIVSANETQYLLTNITLAETASALTDRAALISEHVNRYRLQDSADGIIAPHVGDRVEVTGTVVALSDSSVGTTGKAYDALSEVPAPLLKVQSVKTIPGSSACSS
jgi:hypothetical protein